MITFTSKATASVLMYEEHAKVLLDLLEKNVGFGVITAEETAEAIGIVEREIDSNASQVDDENDGPDSNAPVNFATRVYPFLAMLRAAQAGGHDILWEVQG